jgi:uncharacterized repeat protein (TIGR01451 family)
MAIHRRHAHGAHLILAAAVLALAPELSLAAPDLELRMSVDNPVPVAGQPVEFTVTLSNIGTDPAERAVVNDKLPAELALPAGMAAFPSIGTYDPATGNWSVGTLSPGTSATLVIPAVVAVANQPACSVNVATTSDPGDTHRSNDRALAAVRRSATDRCADLSVTFDSGSFLDCGVQQHLDFSVFVSNLGPEEAREVFVDLSQNPAIAPNLRFRDSNCTGTRCTIALLAAGASVMLNAVSDDFSSTVQRTLTLNLAASSSDTDYSTANNQASTTVLLPVSTQCDGIHIAAGGIACFIATAAYGSPLEAHVEALRQFRDRFLGRFALGRAFIRFYYRHSPPLAEIIAAHPSLRLATRSLLTPLVLAIAYPLRALAVATLMIALLGTAWSRRRRFANRSRLT